MPPPQPPPPSGQQVQRHQHQRKPSPKKAAQPLHGAYFDPWNSSSTGHQRPETTPGTGWRNSRNLKLNSQFRDGASGGERLSDTWGAGSEDWVGEHRTLVPKAVRERACRSVRDMLVQPGKMQESLGNPGDDGGHTTGEEALMEKRRREDEEREAGKAERKIFDGLVVFVNGSTFPLVSDHKLKHLLTENGAQMSLHLGRRRVTHVILGRSAAGGGGLAGGKLDKEIKKVGGAGVKFVGVEWVLESLKVGKRLPEARFSSTKIAPKGQGSVYGLFSKQTPQA
ncbi:hypothetical protein B0T10DRAFT_8613 [Thelonectria olida]|uniref:BRCT domain-containing protein n=1 Tax=Thelonectria olida TaxID=1576542 RepID=A0A9P9AZ22_9HYPO|nr:hypothetical protein B0T10DRAFT_8613 [Thelonectria olida]